MKKRILCFFISAVMLFTALPFAVSAKDEQYPVVIDSGYMTSQIFLFDDNGKIKDRIWHLDILSILKEIVRQTPGVVDGGLEYLSTQSMAKLSDEFSLSVSNILEPMRRYSNGTPAYNTGVWPIAPEESNMKYIKDNIAKVRYLWGTIHENRYMDNLCEKVGAENVFQFSVDWRQEIIFCALDLGKYIKSVLDYTGAKKVNIFSESHGGQTTGTYISLCSIVDKGGKDAEVLATLLGLKAEELKTYFNLDFVNNAVLNSPAIGGVQIAYDFLSGKSHIDIPRVVEFAQAALNPFYFIFGGDKYISESDCEWLLFFAKFDRINQLVNSVIETERLSNVLLSFGSIWDFFDAEHYDEIKAKYINTAEKKSAYAPMIARTDFAHYIIMPNLDNYLSYARSKGVNVSIVCGTDITPATGSSVSSDCIVATKTASGAKVADYGYRFSDGYVTNVKDPLVNCTNAAHNHVSPSMNIDAAYGYLPENTWYIEGQFHAQYAYDHYAIALTDKLLLTDELNDVRSDMAFPQFETTYNAKYGIHAAFDKSEYGRVSVNDSALIIENISNKSGIELVSIKADGSDISFESVSGKKINMGEKVSIPLSAPVKEKGKTNFTVTVYYLADNSAFSIGMRKFNFTSENSDKASYNEKTPFTKVETAPVYISADDVKNTLSNYELDIQVKAIMLIVKRIVSLLTLSFLKVK